MQIDPGELRALEDFVADADGQLRELEAEVGRFNLFDALGIEHAEIRHSNFLAWLLDPAESHGLGSLFLRAFLMELLRQSPPGHRLFSPIYLDGGELRGVEIRREWKHIDLLLAAETPRFVIAIENKINAGISNPLEKYKQSIQSSFADLACKQMFVLLTPEGVELENFPEWVPYSYAQLYGVINKICRTHGDQMGDDVRAFIDHYLSLIRSRLMDDEKIEMLCREIYKNHRRALELIFEHGRMPSAGMAEVVEWMKESPDWNIVKINKRQLFFRPSSWSDPNMPMIQEAGDKRHWVRLMVEWVDALCYFTAFVGPMKNTDYRNRVIHHLCSGGESIGLKVPQKITNSWTRVCKGKTIVKFDPDQSPDPQEISQKVIEVIQKHASPFKGIADLLKEAIQKADKENDTKK